MFTDVADLCEDDPTNLIILKCMSYGLFELCEKNKTSDLTNKHIYHLPAIILNF